MNRTRLLALLLAAMMTVPAQMTAAAAQPQTAVQTGSVAVTQEDKSVETSLSSLENTTVGTTTEFTVTTRGETDLGTTVYGCFTVNSSEPNLGSDGDMTIEYYETPNWVRAGMNCPPITSDRKRASVQCAGHPWRAGSRSPSTSPAAMRSWCSSRKRTAMKWSARLPPLL